MKKLIINHFVNTPGFSNGVMNYIKELNNVLDDDYNVLEKPYAMSMVDFRTYVANYINQSSYSIIECAESQSPSLYLSNDINVHIRMHCPYYLYKKIIHEKPDESRFSDEVRAMYKAKAVSSPSFGMLELLKDELNIENIHVYKNPVQKKLNLFLPPKDKTIDVLFLSRFNTLKGNEYLDELINLLPKNYNIVIAGKQEENINLKDDYPNVTILDHIEGDEKFKLLANSKVAISLSKFENCSMAILEALSVGTPVVAWDVGGNAEMAPSSILRVAQLDNVEEFAFLINDMTNREYEVKDFEEVLDLLNEDFCNGIKHVEQYVLGNKSNIYKGINFSSTHKNSIHYINLSKKINQELISPINVLLITSSVVCARFFYNYSNKEGVKINLSIAYQGKYWGEIKSISDYHIPKELLNTKHLENFIKVSKASVIIFDSSYPILVNDIYGLQKSLKIKVLFSEKSFVNRNSYLLNDAGFAEKSRLFVTKLKSKPQLVELVDKKILIWAENLQDYNEIDFEKLNRFLVDNDNDNEIDFVGSIELFDKLSEFLNLNLLDNNINKNDYSIILSCSDYGLIDFLSYVNSIHLINRKSFFYNKNIDSIVHVDSKSFVDVGSRNAVKDFLSSYDLSNKDNLMNYLLNKLMHS